MLDGVIALMTAPRWVDGVISFKVGGGIDNASRVSSCQGGWFNGGGCFKVSGGLMVS